MNTHERSLCERAIAQARKKSSSTSRASFRNTSGSRVVSSSWMSFLGIRQVRSCAGSCKSRTAQGRRSCDYSHIEAVGLDGASQWQSQTVDSALADPYSAYIEQLDLSHKLSEARNSFSVTTITAIYPRRR